MPPWLDNLYMGAVEAWHALQPSARPSRDQLERVKIVSHRGERDDLAVLENTLPAFEALRGSGVFGIEFDVRWTADLVPVVVHDEDLRRIFEDPARVAELDWATLQRRQPQVPGLHAFVRRFVDEFHLMVELKDEPYPDRSQQERRLLEALAPALERRRCHVLSLRPELFRRVPGIPADCTMGVARLNADEICAEALRSGRAAFACHYSALSPRHIGQLHAAGRAAGCGFPASQKVLLREAARGVDYVFTNQALDLQRWRSEVLKAL
jgi:glycerophosphoryl diester phosphodiesterase